MRTNGNRNLLLLVLCPLLSASTAFAGSSGPIPLSADLVITRVNESGQTATTTSRFSRDGKGRTRVEDDGLVTIMDPVAETTIYLFPKTRTYLQQSWAAPAGEVERAGTSDPFQKTEASLGSRSIEGWSTEGRLYTIVVPGNESQGRSSVTRQVSLWLSQDLQIPVTTEVDDPVNGPFSLRYTNIVAGIDPDPSLFRVPAGYSVQPPVNQPVQVQRCNLRINPDPLILNSFGPVLGRGTMTATTSANRGCRFVYVEAIAEYPLRFTFLTAIGLPTFSIRWRDNGGPLSYVPYVALGYAVFVAANGQDTTTKDGLVVLTVWF